MTTKDGRKRCGLRRGAAALLALTLSNGLARAQAPQPPGMAAVSAALGHMKTSGAPLVVVVTSAARPESRAFYRALFEGPWARDNRGIVQIVELPAEGNAATIERLRVTSMPSVLAYTAGPDGPVCRGLKVGGSIEEVVAWLGSMGIGDARVASATVDPAVIPVAHDGTPSPQQPYTAPPPPPVAAPPAYTYTPTYAAPPPQAPVYATPAPVMAPAPSYVQLPGPQVVVQQGQPQVFVTQAAPPQPSFAAQPMMATPNMYLPTAAAAPQPSFAAQPMAAPAPVAYAAQPAAAPVAYAAQPAAYAAQPTAAYAAAPMPYAAVTNQMTALPVTGSRTRVRVRGPGPIRSGLASLGEKMTQLGRSRIETVQETELNTPAVQGGSGVATFATTHTTPVGAPQMQTVYVPQPVATSPPQQPVYESAPPVTPSPQGAPQKHGHFLKKLTGD